MLNKAILLASAQRIPVVVGPVPVVESAEAGITASPATSVTCAKPSGVVAGDLLLALHVRDGGGALTPPGSFTSIAEVDGVQADIEASWKIAGESEPTSYVAGTAAAEQQHLFMLRISGHNATTPIAGFGSDSGDSLTPTCPSIVTAGSNRLIIRFFGANGSAITTDSGYPAGTTGLFVRTQPSGMGRSSGGVSHENKITPGATGSAAFSMTNSNDWAALSIAIQP